MIDDDAFYDALLKARRGQLGAAEHRELAAALARSSTLRLALQAHQDFEQLGAYEPRDDERSQEIARAVRERLGYAAHRKRWGYARRTQAAVLALVFAAGAAAASVASWKLASGGGRDASLAPRPTVVRPDAAMAALPAIASERAAPAVDEAPPQAAPAASGDPAPPEPRASSKRTDEQLFSRASELKSAGDWRGALVLYEQLLREYPHSKYAPASVMTLGKSALAQGQAERALSWFRRYHVLGGPLAAEALWGEAEALGRLGRAQERAKVQAILSKRFPLSPYASPPSSPSLQTGK